MPHEHHFQFDCNAVLFDLDGVLVDSRHCVDGIGWSGPTATISTPIRCCITPTAGARWKRSGSWRRTSTRSARRPSWKQARSMTPPDWQKSPARWSSCSRSPRMPGELLHRGRMLSPPPAWRLAGCRCRMCSILRDDVIEVKPNPEAYLFAALMLGVKPASCVVVEDAPSGIQAGRAAGNCTSSG